MKTNYQKAIKAITDEIEQQLYYYESERASPGPNHDRSEERIKNSSERVYKLRSLRLDLESLAALSKV